MIKYGPTPVPRAPRTVQHHDSAEARRRIAEATFLADQGGATPAVTGHGKAYGNDKTASRYGRLAEAYLTAGSDASPVGHWMQAVARGAQGFTGGLYAGMARDEERAAVERATAAASAKESRDASAALDKERRDHDRALELVRAKATIAQDDPAYQARLAKTRAETEAISAKDRYRSTLMEMLTGGEAASNPSTPLAAPNIHDSLNVDGPMPANVDPPGTSPVPAVPSPGPPTQAPSPGIQPQSFNPAMPSPASTPIAQPAAQPDVDPNARRRMAATLAADSSALPAHQSAGPQLMPGVQLVNDPAATSPMAAGAPPPMPSAPQQQPPAEDLVQTPRGRIPREEARRIGNALLFDPAYSAVGKEFLDAARATTAPDLAKPAINTLQERQLNSAEAYTRLTSIEQSWKPEYQTIESRLGFKWNSLIDKFSSTRQSLSPEQRQELAAFHSNKAEALNNLNLYIKEITGAQMSIQEAHRIRRSMPDPGEGVFDGDSPIEFEAKLTSNIRITKMALARYNYFMRNGFPGDVEQLAREMPLDQMPSLIQERTNAIKQDILNSNPGLDASDVVPIIRQRLRAEFGVDA